MRLASSFISPLAAGLRRFGLCGALAAALVLSAAGVAHAAKKVALVIGNARYVHETTLKNPINDARRMSELLRGMGFEVETVSNLTEAEMGRAFGRFARAARGADTAMIFYSGHGMEIGGVNYLIPVDAELRHPDDAVYQAVPLNQAIAATSRAKRLSIVVVDACRDNIFLPTTRGGTKGLARVSAKPGQVIAFSTKPGAVAFDGAGSLSPYTQALVEQLSKTPNLDVRRLFTSLGPRVEELAGQNQEPYAEFGRLPIDDVTLTGGAAPLSPPQRRQPERPPETATGPVGGPGRPFTDCRDCPMMIPLPAGSFMMGAPEGERGGLASEKPQRRVSVRPFALAQTEVTFAQWDACLADGGCNGYNPNDNGWGRGSRPVVYVNKADALSYIAWLNGKVRGTPYRLPTEAEWEYAARSGGRPDPYVTGARLTKSQANYNNRSTIEVASFAPSPWGFYDLHGNAQEWTADCWNRTYDGAPSDSRPWTGGDCASTPMRGGAWHLQPTRIAYRYPFSVGSRGYTIGLRVARDLR